jgi:hypothetical protein
MAAARADPTGAPIEALFRPTTRLQDLYDIRRDLPEVELLPHLTPPDVLATSHITWDHLCRFVGDDKLVLMMPGIFVRAPLRLLMMPDIFARAPLRPSIHTIYPTPLRLGAQDVQLCVHVERGMAAAPAREFCDLLVRLLATSELHEVEMSGRFSTIPISGAGLSLFFQESRDNLRKVTLNYTALSEDQCRALATMSRLDVELNIGFCSLADGASDAFVECLQSDRGPVWLNRCDVGSQILASALTGDSRVARLWLGGSANNDAGHSTIFRALAHNRNLVEVSLITHSISNENLTILCQSLMVHPTLTILDLRDTVPLRRFVLWQHKEGRTRAIADMMEQNTILHTLQLSEEEHDRRIYLEVIQPHLETNLYRPRVLAVKRADISLRRTLLGLALQTESVRNTSNLLWMFLSENVDVALCPID